MPKLEMPSYVLELPLITEIYQVHILDRRLEIGRQIYNSLLTMTQKRYAEMIKTNLYRDLMFDLKSVNQELEKCKDDEREKDLKRQKKLILADLTKLRKTYKLTEYDFHKDVKRMQHHFKKNIDSFTAQKIASRLWSSYEKLIFGAGIELHYQKFGNFNSLEGKSNTAGIRYKNGIIKWNGLQLKVVIDPNNAYERYPFRYEDDKKKFDLKYCRIIRKIIRGKHKYYVQFVFGGIPFPKYDKETGEIKHQLGVGRVGIDIGTQTIAISSASEVKIVELADEIQKIEDEKRRILRKLDRSRRATNPQNYNEDGTIKKQGSKKVKWHRSNRYLKILYELKDIQRKQKAIRKIQHETLANDVLSLGNEFYVEQMNFKALQKRAKETKQDESGKYKRKKRFGKSIANKAPAMLLSIVRRKLKYVNRVLHEINTWTVKASQYNHQTDEYQKKKLSERLTIIGEDTVQRDLYSAFLIMNANDDLQTINKEKCDKTYENFRLLHDQEIIRLRGNKNLSSIGI